MIPAHVLSLGLLLFASTLALEPPPATRQEPGPDERAREYLERGLAQLQHLGGKIPRLGPQRDAAGALAAAALAARGAETRAAARQFAASALGACEERWHRVECERVELALQRLILQYPKALPTALRQRLRAAVTTAAPPPTAAEIADPWGFRETENQRIVKVARSLVAWVVAGRPEAPEALAWARYAEAFLAAHDRDGWYEADSPGYLAVSLTALLHLADHAPQVRVRELAVRQLHLLFAAWAQEQAGGFPAGAKSRAYVHWALGTRNTPWLAWAWLLAGVGDPGEVSFMDWPELAASGYRPPPVVARLLAERRLQPPYEIRSLRRIRLVHRGDLAAALYSYATPDYILSAAQTVDGLKLQVSGGQEIMAALYPEGGFAPVYLWSRSANPRRDRWQTAAGRDFAVGHRNRVLAQLGDEGHVGHVYLAPGWSRPEAVADGVLVTRLGEVHLLLASAGGWQVAPAPERFPEYYGGDKNFRGSWAAVPAAQPARVALEVGRRSEDGEFPTWREKAAAARIAVEDGELRFRGTDGTALAFRPGRSARMDDEPLRPEAYPHLAAPYLARDASGWRFTFGQTDLRLPPLPPLPARAGRSSEGRGGAPAER